jgi:biopolymer transport protein ExbD
MKRKNSKQESVTEVNLTSLVDVALTLVIIFMVASPFVLQSGIKVSTPDLQKAEKVAEATDVKAEILLKSDGALLLNGKVIPVRMFSDSLRNCLAVSKNKQVLISAEGDVLHDQVIAVMDEAKQCGASKLSLIRQKL